ncbi:hypothetical protein B4U79_18465 [Dinothrombium tinctorium]|uniref:RING-type domain-containing protein n=1 Tax=Dinothrombium tinctorium TaxID=1965070 RepID=A0A3S3Q3N6_9ACAR|nr:hypothetical protein B4U79_18741 [Dinothrombium tinctorium]RWS01374.1 hypothetical protein B4U79_18573 [Dinothrombium tinctorium]RWS02834.1 hypothetical protein B4U79_18465 [Dinothrombium tinctorium]
MNDLVEFEKFFDGENELREEQKTWRDKNYIRWKDMLENISDDENVDISKCKHSRYCCININTPYLGGFIMNEAIISSNDQNLYILNHILLIECEICLNIVRSDKIMVDFMCGHTMCIQCMIGLRDQKCDKCPFCRNIILYIHPFMQIPETFIEKQIPYRVQKIEENTTITLYVDSVSGQLDIYFMSSEEVEKNSDSFDSFQKQRIYANVCEIQWLKIK